MTNVNEFTSDDINERVTKSIDKFMKNEWKLLKVDAHERSITHRFAIYLQENFTKLDVDCEYNRDGIIPKVLNIPISSSTTDDTQAKTVFPDIIIHKRGTNKNLLVIEAKKSSSRSSEARLDEEKLNAYITQLHYRFGLFIKFNVGTEYRKRPEVWFYPRTNRA